MAKPTFLKEEYGVKRFALTSEHYMHPCRLFENMTEDVDICAAGAFVGELRNLAEYTQDSVISQVSAVKNALQSDKHQRVDRQMFHPVVQERECLWSDYGTLYIVPQQQYYKERQKGRKKFIDEITSIDFQNRPATTLEKALESGGVSKMLDTFFDGCSEENFKIWYGPGFEMPAGKEIGITPELKMRKMVSPNISHLRVVHPNGEEQNVIPGINTPTIYIGTEFSSFNLHHEDFFFESINRMVEGSEKVWFVIPPAYNHSFTVWMSQCGVFRQGTTDTNCASFLQHKHNFVDPRAVVAAGFPVRTIRQRPGDVVYLLPAAIHWGINVGYNINEAVNCASGAWIKSGMMAKASCACPTTSLDMVGVQLDSVLLAAGVTPNNFEKWKRGRIVDVFRTNDVMNPYGLSRGACPTNLSLLLGEEIESEQESPLDCKEVRTSFYQFRGPILDGFIGTLTCITLDDDEEIEDEDETGQEATATQTNEDDEEEHEEEEKEEVVKKGRKKLECQYPACGQTYQGGMVKRLRKHIEVKHAGDEYMAEALRAVDAICPPRTKTKRLQCPRCGKHIAGRGGEMRKHQNSTGCVGK